MASRFERITIEAGKCSGEPCIRGLRIPVHLVVSLIAAGETFETILDNYPDLYVYGVLTHHAGLIRDIQAAQGWAQGYDVAIKDAQANDSTVRMSGGQPSPYVRTAP